MSVICLCATPLSIYLRTVAASALSPTPSRVSQIVRCWQVFMERPWRTIRGVKQWIWLELTSKSRRTWKSPCFLNVKGNWERPAWLRARGIVSEWNRLPEEGQGRGGLGRREIQEAITSSREQIFVWFMAESLCLEQGWRHSRQLVCTLLHEGVNKRWVRILGSRNQPWLTFRRL